MSEIALSIVVPAYGEASQLRELLGDLLAQRDLEPSCELLIVDDGSAEPVADSIRDVCARFAAPVSCLRKANGGGPSARNAGARAARGRLLLFLDQDLRVGPDFVSAHVRSHKSVDRAAVSAFYENRLIEREGPFARWYAETCSRWEAGARANATPVTPDLYEVHPVMLSSTNLSLARDLFVAADGFPVFRRTGVEDQAFGFVLGRMGVKVLRMDRACPLHVERRASIESFCSRQRVGSAATVELITRFPETFGALEATPLHRTNGPALPGREPLALTSRKLIKALVLRWPALPLLRAVIGMLEVATPRANALRRCYDLLVGAHIQRGWREGLADFPFPGSH